MLVISTPPHFEKVTWMRNPFKPLFSSEDEIKTNERCNKLADFIEEHTDIFPLCALTNLDSIESLRQSKLDGNLNNIGFALHPTLNVLVFLGFWVHPSWFCNESVEVKTIEEFLTKAKEELN